MINSSKLKWDKVEANLQFFFFPPSFSGKSLTKTLFIPLVIVEFLSNKVE